MSTKCHAALLLSLIRRRNFVAIRKNHTTKFVKYHCFRMFSEHSAVFSPPPILVLRIECYQGIRQFSLAHRSFFFQLFSRHSASYLSFFFFWGSGVHAKPAYCTGTICKGELGPIARLTDAYVG